MRKSGLAILGLFLGALLGGVTFGAIGDVMVPAQEFGPLGMIVGAIIVGVPIGGLAGFLLGLGVGTSRNGSTAFSKQRVLGLALGIILGGFIGMDLGFRSERFLIVYGVPAIGGLAGYILGFVSERWCCGQPRHKMIHRRGRRDDNQTIKNR